MALGEAWRGVFPRTWTRRGRLGKRTRGDRWPPLGHPRLEGGAPASHVGDGPSATCEGQRGVPAASLLPCAAEVCVLPLARFQGDRCPLPRSCPLSSY